MKAVRKRNKLKTFLIIFFGFFLIVFLIVDDRFSVNGGVDGSMVLDSREFINVNGVDLFVSIRAEKENAPILLYLHGGPGDAALPLVLKYNKELEKEFTVVILEQRGAGKSYYKFNEGDELTIDTFVEDAFQLTQVLLERYNQDKIYLVGHSWGSVIGLNFALKHPGVINTYIGCGQVINMIKSSQSAYDYALSKNQEASNTKVVAKLESINPAYTQDTWFNDLLYTTKQVVKFEGSLYGKSNYNSLVKEFILSNKYNIRDLINRQRGAKQSIEFLWQELMMTNFEDNTSFDVPVIFIEGRYDFHVSSMLVEEYFETIQSEKKFYWFEESSHFPQWSEAKRFNDIVLGLL